MTDDPAVPHKESVSSTPNNIDSPDINKELSTYKDRSVLKLNNVKKLLEAQRRIEVECTKQNLKSEFDHKLRHQTLTQTETINTLRRQIDQLGMQLQQQQAATQHTCSVLSQAPPFQDTTLPSPTTHTPFQPKCLNNK